MFPFQWYAQIYFACPHAVHNSSCIVLRFELAFSGTQIQHPHVQWIWTFGGAIGATRRPTCRKANVPTGFVSRTQTLHALATNKCAFMLEALWYGLGGHGGADAADDDPGLVLSCASSNA